MRVGVLIHGALGSQTGGYLYDRCLIRHLRRRGHRVTVQTLPRRAGARLLLDNARPLPGLDHLPGCDLLLEDALGLAGLLRFNRRCRARGRPRVVAIVHQLRTLQEPPGWRRLLWRALERSFLRHLDGALCNGAYTAQGVRRLAGGALPVAAAPPGGDRLGSLAPGHDTGRRARKAGPLELVLLGNVTPNKGIVPALAALADHGDGHWRLTVVGSLAMDGAYARRAQALAAARWPPGQVRFSGPLDGAALREVLARAQLNVLPFSVESFGIGLLEGMAFGLPAIGCAAGGAGQTIRPGTNGYLVPPGAGAEFAGQVARLNADRELLARLSAGALARFHGLPGWSRTLDGGVRFLEQLLPPDDRRGSGEGDVDLTPGR